MSRDARPMGCGSSPEQGVRAGAMVHRMVDLFSAAGDLALQRGDPRLKLHHRQAVEILAQQRGQRIVGPGPEDIVQIHARIVDPRGYEVNKAGPGDQGGDG